MTTSRRKRGPAGRLSASRMAKVGRRTTTRVAKKATAKKAGVKRKTVKAAKKVAAKAKAAPKAKAATKKKSAPKSRKTAAARLSPENAATKKRLEAQVKAISKEIDRADALAKAALKAAEKRTLNIVKKLRADRAKLQARLKTITGKGESAFDEVKTGVEAAYQDLSVAIVKAIGHFK